MGNALSRLKDLSAWRLFRELNNDYDAANRFANEHRKKWTRPQIRERYKTHEERKRYEPSDPRPFLDAKGGGGVPPNQMDLFHGDPDARKAWDRAWAHLVEFIPEEFGRFPALARSKPLSGSS